jgi:hypothetical protein
MLILTRRFALFSQFLWRVLPFIAFPSWIYVFNYQIFFWLISWIFSPLIFLLGFFIWLLRTYVVELGFAVRVLSLFMVLRLTQGFVGYQLAEMESGHWTVYEDIVLPASIAYRRDGGINDEIAGCGTVNRTLANRNISYELCRSNSGFIVDNKKYSPGLYKMSLDVNHHECSRFLLPMTVKDFQSIGTEIDACTKFDRVDTESHVYEYIYNDGYEERKYYEACQWFFGLCSRINVYTIIRADSKKIVGQMKIIRIRRYNLMSFTEGSAPPGVFEPIYFSSKKDYGYQIFDSFSIFVAKFFDPRKFIDNEPSGE